MPGTRPEQESSESGPKSTAYEATANAGHCVWIAPPSVHAVAARPTRARGGTKSSDMAPPMARPPGGPTAGSSKA